MALIDSITLSMSKFSNQIHLKSLRESFWLASPVFFAASFLLIFTHVIAPAMFSGELLRHIRLFGNLITQSTIGITAILITPSIAYILAKNRQYDNAIAPAITAISTLFIMMPIQEAVRTGYTVDVKNFALPIGNISLFSGVIIGLLSSEVCMYIAKRGWVIPFGKNVPPLVSGTYTTLLPAMITIAIFALVAVGFEIIWQTSVVELINQFIQKPLQAINSSIYGYTLIYSIGNILFSFGIHHTGLTGITLEPFMLLNMNENIQAFAQGREIPHILTSAFQTSFSQMGGSGGTVALLLAIFLFSREQSSRGVAKLAVMPGMFGINEPIIFGFPIVFNLPMIIPFVLVPAVSSVIAYYAIDFGYVSKTVAMLPWTTPPFISGYVSTAGDWRAVILQGILILIGAAIYLPFMRFSERVAKLALQQSN